MLKNIFLLYGYYLFYDRHSEADSRYAYKNHERNYYLL